MAMLQSLLLLAGANDPVIPFEWRQGSWKVVGRLEPAESGARAKLCVAQSGRIELFLAGDGHARVLLNGSVDPQAVGPAVSVRIDRKSYQVQNISTVDQPPGADGAKNAIVTGYVGVRANADAPWLPASSLLPEMLNARTLTVEYRKKADDQPGPVTRISYAMGGLQGGLAACQRAMNFPGT